MVRVATQGRYRVYVYAERGGQHNAPHCHVEWADGFCVIEIATLTKRRVLTREELAARVGLPERTILRIEQGRYTAPFKTRKKLRRRWATRSKIYCP